jgi:hypothetical protein
MSALTAAGNSPEWKSASDPEKAARLAAFFISKPACERAPDRPPMFIRPFIIALLTRAAPAPSRPTAM